jgi:hypothetical protein
MENVHVIRETSGGTDGGHTRVELPHRLSAPLSSDDGPLKTVVFLPLGGTTVWGKARVAARLPRRSTEALQPGRIVGRDPMPMGLARSPGRGKGRTESRRPPSGQAPVVGSRRGARLRLQPCRARLIFRSCQAPPVPSRHAACIAGFVSTHCCIAACRLARSPPEVQLGEVDGPEVAAPDLPGNRKMSILTTISTRI